MISMEQYKSTLAEAEHVAALLRTALAREGIAECAAARVRPLVTSAGRGHVELGTLRVRDAQRILDALGRGGAAGEGQPSVPNSRSAASANR
ncbi:hypothetical protein [Streptomyces crystallinus]|uniref:DUF2007 domain-containing protein n=1 Tax=Streptomyces crystallinus TaxID=68191 RepID=A0ABN1H238_9ACTN